MPRMRTLLLVSLLVIGLSPLGTPDAFAHGARPGHEHHRHHHRHRHHRHHRHRHRYYRHAEPGWPWPAWGDAPGGYFSFYGSNGGAGFAIGIPLSPIERRTEPVYRERLAERMPPAAPPPPALPRGCRQTREFQTEIIIEGRVVPAFGTACLMPDGSWRQLGIDGTGR